jgi:hypothetical protein
MRPHNCTVDEEVLSYMTAILLQALPELPPETTGLPAAEAVVHGIPVAKFGGHIAPGHAGAGNIQDGFDEQPITQFRRTAGLVFDGSESRFNLCPGGISDKHAYGHRRSPPRIDHEGKRKTPP